MIVAVPAATVKVPGRRKGVSVNNLDGVRESERSQKSKIVSKPMPNILRESPASIFQHQRNSTGLTSANTIYPKRRL